MEEIFHKLEFIIAYNITLIYIYVNKYINMSKIHKKIRKQIIEGKEEENIHRKGRRQEQKRERMNRGMNNLLVY